MSNPFISEIVLSSENSTNTITLDSTSLFAVVGPNNAGKSHFLKTIRSSLHGETVKEIPPNSGALSGLRISWTGDYQETLSTITRHVEQNFTKNNVYYHANDGITYSSPEDRAIHEESFKHFPTRGNKLGVLTSLFLEFDDALNRISETELKGLTPNSHRNKATLVQLAKQNPQISALIGTYFKQIFHEEVSYYDRGTGTVGFLLAAPLPTASRLGEALSLESTNYMDSSPKLWLQGFGMRSVMGLLLRIFATEKPIIVIDEPEAFLHPPQAAALGAVLAEIAATHKKQIILATHDRNLINGLLRNSGTKLSIHRLRRINDSSIAVPITLDSLKRVKEKSIMRYSTVLDSIFYRVTVLVENEQDAYFYSAAIEHALMSEEARSLRISIDEIHFLSTSGKGALARTADLLKSLESFVVVIADFDLVDSFDQLEKTTKATAGHIPASLNQLHKRLVEVSGICTKDQNEFRKKFNKIKPTCNRPEGFSEAAKMLISELDEHNIVLNQLGELEDFSLENLPKGEWANTAIQMRIHENEEAQKLAFRVLRTIFSSAEFVR